jgi:hypothetical protein
MISGNHSLPLHWLVILWFNGNYFFAKQYKKRTKELLITTAGLTFSSSFYQNNKRENTKNTCQFTTKSTRTRICF